MENGMIMFYICSLLNGSCLLMQTAPLVVSWKSLPSSHYQHSPLLITEKVWHAAITSAADIDVMSTLIARFMGPAWGPSGAKRTQVGPILVPWTLLSGIISGKLKGLLEHLATDRKMNPFMMYKIDLYIILIKTLLITQLPNMEVGWYHNVTS